MDAELKDHNIRQLVNDLRNIAEKFHAHGSLRDRISGAVGQFIDAHFDRRAAPSSSADELPPLPAGLCRDDTEHDVEYFTAEQYREGQQQAYAIGRGAAVRDYISPKGAIQAAAPADAPQTPVAWALVSPKGGIKKLAITRASVESRMARWLEEWPGNTPRIRPLVYGDVGAPAEDAREQQPVERIDLQLCVLEWNRAQSDPPIAIGREYFVAQEIVAMLAHRATGTDRAQAGE